MTRMLLLTALVAVTFTLASCQAVGIVEDPKTLNRAKAQAMIEQSDAFQKPLDFNFQLAPTNPRVFVMRHFGYVEPEELALTEKGRRLWGELGFQVKDGAVPLAHKELIEVSGISTSGNDADAKFSWRWVPNDAGKALVLDSPEFKALPEDLQAKVRRPAGTSTMIFGGSSDSGIAYGGTRQGTANLQLFDDGWRARAVYTF